jgi:uncharacterized membrane protein YkoI
MKRIARMTVLAGLMIALAGANAKETKESQRSLMAEAKIDQAQAQKIALTKAPGGTVQTSELEREHGHLVWSFDIATPKSRDITEVQVDAVSGNIVNVAKENPAKQAAETQADQAKK